MKTYQVALSDNATVTVASEWVLLALLDEAIENDQDYRIYEFNKFGESVPAEFYCGHSQYVCNQYGGYEDYCENMAADPFGCNDHRKPGY